MPATSIFCHFRHQPGRGENIPSAPRLTPFRTGDPANPPPVFQILRPRPPRCPLLLLHPLHDEAVQGLICGLPISYHFSPAPANHGFTSESWAHNLWLCLCKKIALFPALEPMAVAIEWFRVHHVSVEHAQDQKMGLTGVRIKPI